MRTRLSVARAREPGFTMVELVLVLVLIGILSAFVVSKAMPRAGESTAGYQAVRLANDLRHTQMLAMAWGRNLNFVATSGSYSVSCASGVSPGPCASSPVLDPGHSGPFDVALENVTLAVVTGPNPLTFDIVGKPSAAASFTLAAGGVTLATVTVAANTGFVTVQ